MSEVLGLLLLLVFLVLVLLFVVVGALYLLSALGLITLSLGAIGSLFSGTRDEPEAVERDA